jgi:osmotically-inducible protein OsmY
MRKISTAAAKQGRNFSGPVDSCITREIRSSIMKDKCLSTYAHNIKIISKEGMVTLKEPVRFDAERTAIEAKAREIAGASNVR